MTVPLGKVSPSFSVVMSICVQSGPMMTVPGLMTNTFSSTLVSLLIVPLVVVVVVVPLLVELVIVVLLLVGLLVLLEPNMLLSR